MLDLKSLAPEIRGPTPGFFVARGSDARSHPRLRDLLVSPYRDEKTGEVKWVPGWDQLVKRWPEKFTRFEYNPLTGQQDAVIGITAQEVTAVEEMIQHVLHFNPVADSFLEIRDVGRGMLKYSFAKWKSILPPRWTNTFIGRRPLRTVKEETEVELIGMDYDYELSMPEIDYASNANRSRQYSESLLEGTAGEMVTNLAQYREWVIMRGTDVPGKDDISQTGLFNDSSLVDPGAMGIGADDDLTAAGDIVHSVTKLAGLAMEQKQAPPFDIHATIGVAIQMIKNRDTEGVTDWTHIMEMAAPSGQGQMFTNRVIINPYMIDSATETNSTGALAVTKSTSKVGANFYVVESYPLDFYPLPPQGLGVAGKFLWMGRAVVRNPGAIQFADNLTINTLSS